MKTFSEFLAGCKDEHNHHNQNVKNSYEANWQPMLEQYRANRKLPDGLKLKQIELEGVIQYNLSDEEAFYILANTSSYSSWINEPLRSGRELETKCKQYFANGLERALQKLPSYNNQQVYRMDMPLGMEEDVLSWFEKNKGEVVKTPYFLSTSKDNWDNTLVTWSIRTLKNNSRAKDISLITNDKTEKEVLFNRNACFKILDVNREKRQVEMLEVDEPSEATDLTGFYFDL